MSVPKGTWYMYKWNWASFWNSSFSIVDQERMSSGPCP